MVPQPPNESDASQDDCGDGPAVTGDPHEKYARSLSDEERLLISLRADLYNDSWDAMLADLEDRLKGRPYIFKLVHRIEEDISRVQKLQAYEQKHLIDLHDYIEST